MKWKLLIAAGALGLLAACTNTMNSMFREEAIVAEKTPSQLLLESLPMAKQPIDIAVYEFFDQTGQNKASESFADFSRAVTQGGIHILNKALLDAGKGTWFNVIERAGLNNLSKERQIIKNVGEAYRAPNGQPSIDTKPMQVARVILEGGIVAYESNLLTGGAGAGYLGIGASTQYRRDMVTIYLRLVDVQNGKVLASVNTSKTIYSTLVQSSVFKYVEYNELLEGEIGYSVNEPPQIAVRQAIEYGVYSLIMEGRLKNLWNFANPAEAKDQLKTYLKRRDGKERSDAEIYSLLGVNAPAPMAPVSPYEPEPVDARMPVPQAEVPPIVTTQPQPVSRDLESMRVPADARFVPPAPSAQPEAPFPAPKAPTRSYLGGNGGPAYDVVCTASGCFPANSLKQE